MYCYYSFQIWPSYLLLVYTERMATLLGVHCPSLSARLCLIAGSRSLSLPSRLCQGASSCLHSHAARQMMKMETLSVMPYVITSLTPKHSSCTLHLGRRISSLSLGRTISVRMLHNLGCKQNGHVSPVLVMRLGDKMMYIRCLSSSGREKRMSPTDVLLYMLSMLTLCLALAYVGVPLFKLFCRVCITLAYIVCIIIQDALLCMYIVWHSHMPVYHC